MSGLELRDCSQIQLTLNTALWYSGLVDFENNNLFKKISQWWVSVLELRDSSEIQLFLCIPLSYNGLVCLETSNNLEKKKFCNAHFTVVQLTEKPLSADEF